MHCIEDTYFTLILCYQDFQHQGESELLAALVPLAQWVGLDNPGQQVTDVQCSLLFQYKET